VVSNSVALACMSVMAETYYSSNFIIGEINYLKLRSLKVIANDTVMHTYHLDILLTISSNLRRPKA